MSRNEDPVGRFPAGGYDSPVFTATQLVHPSVLVNTLPSVPAYNRPVESETSESMFWFA